MRFPFAIFANMIKNLIFDWGGVLSVSDHEAAVGRFKALGLCNAESYFKAGCNWQSIFGEVESGKLSADEFLSAFSRLCGHPVSFAEVACAWWGFFSHLQPGILQALDTWHHHYDIYLLTNNNPFMMSYIRSEEFAPEGRPFCTYFRKMYVSCECHLAKPDPAIYRYVLNDAHLQSSESIFVDDRFSNLEGAAQVGLATFLVKNGENWIPEFEQRLNSEP